MKDLPLSAPQKPLCSPSRHQLPPEGVTWGSSVTLTDSFSRLALVGLVQVAKERWEERDVEASLDGFCYKIEKNQKKKTGQKPEGKVGSSERICSFLRREEQRHVTLSSSSWKVCPEAWIWVAPFTPAPGRAGDRFRAPVHEKKCVWHTQQNDL